MSQTFRDADVAIIGMSGRFPGASTIEQFWQNLCAGQASTRQLSQDEMLKNGVPASFMAHPNYVPLISSPEDVAAFDPAFFGLSPRDAMLMDPQHRVFLEICWEALERAGHTAADSDGSIGVFAGCGLSTYLLANIAAEQEILQSTEYHRVILGNDKDFLATRISYLLNLQGPSISVQTACSTSLVAIHLAYQSLLNCECDMALAGGVTYRFPQGGYLYQPGGVFSPDGTCRTFDANAEGTIFGSGAGVVLLKRLEDAVADRNEIIAVIKSTAVNNDGAAKVGFTAPSVGKQAEVIATAWEMADVDPQTVGYIEAHGTATPLGDPIEMAALSQVFPRTEEAPPCAIGAVKSNVGHLDTAAGVTSVIKAALMVYHGELLPSLHFEQPNPQIDFQNSRFYVNVERQPWISETPRRAGVSSFGMGGTNAHLVLEQAPTIATASAAAAPCLLPLSAQTETALQHVATRLADFLERSNDSCLTDVAFTLQNGRLPLPYRQTLVCHNKAEAIAQLRALTQGVTAAESPRIVFLFSGQGTQYKGMAAQLYESAPVFRDYIDQCSVLAEPMLGQDLRHLMWQDESGDLADTAVAQPLLFALEYALAQLWLSRGVQPTAMIGHSLGEYVAACLSGVFSLEDALRLTIRRGALMQACAPGKMLSVRCSEAELLPLLNKDVSLAAVNSRQSCVVSGTYQAIDAFAVTLTEHEIVFRPLHTSHAFHSYMMQPALDKFLAEFHTVQLHKPTIPYLSNISGDWIRAEQATDPDYWAQHICASVRFAESLTKLAHDDPQVLLEVGPGRTLTTFARQQLDAATTIVLPSLRHPKEEIDDVLFWLKAEGTLWAAGVSLEWDVPLNGRTQPRRVCLPTYPFERQTYWIETKGPVVKQSPAPPKSNLEEKFESIQPAMDTELETIIANQLAVMNRQIALLTH